MRLAVLTVVMAAFAATAQAEELAPATRPTLAAQGETILATPAYSQPGSWQARVSRNRGTGSPTRRAVILGALIGGAAGFVTGAVVEHQMGGTGGVGPVTMLGTGIGAGGGAAVGLALRLR